MKNNAFFFFFQFFGSCGAHKHDLNRQLSLEGKKRLVDRILAVDHVWILRYLQKRPDSKIYFFNFCGAPLQDPNHSNTLDGRN